jgi:hypothetical protein
MECLDVTRRHPKKTGRHLVNAGLRDEQRGYALLRTQQKVIASNVRCEAISRRSLELASCATQPFDFAVHPFVLSVMQ